MTEPDATGTDRPIGEVIKDTIDDILNPPKPIGDTIGDIAKQIVGDQPASGGGAIAGIGGGLKDIFVDKDGDGTPDIFEQVGKMGVPRSELTQVRDDAKVQDFLQNALAQIGDKYQRGVENSLSNADPDRWDGSELVEWAANRAGVMVNDGAANQYRQMTGKGGALSPEDALHTPGAILYEFTGDPVNGQPTRASTAISLGDGRIIDIDPKEGVRIIDATGMHFTHAAVMPGFTDAKDPGAGALNVVHEALVKHGIEEAAPPVEDTPEIAALAARAAELRAQYTNAQFGEGRTERGEHRSEVERQQKLAEVGLQMANEEVTSRLQKADERLARAADLETQAAAAETRGDTAGAQELREDAARTRLAGESDQGLAEHARGEAAKYQEQLDAAKSEMAKIDEATGPRFELAGKGEDALDQLEQKVVLMRTAHAQATLVTGLERRETEARTAGDTAQADQLATQAQAARATADRMQQAAEAAPVDEPTLQQIQDLPAPTTSATPSAGDTAAESSSGSTTTPTPSDTDDGPAVADTEEIVQLAERAAHLRAQALTVIREQAVDRSGDARDASRAQIQAATALKDAELELDAVRGAQQEAQSKADNDERRATEALATGDTRGAEELREHAAKMLVLVRANDENATRLTTDVEQFKAQAARAQEQLDGMKQAENHRIQQLNNAEDAIDAMENRVRALREVNAETTLAADLDRQATAARTSGNAAEAQRLADEAVAHRTAAQAAQTQVETLKVDEAALEILEGVDVATQPPLGSPPAPAPAPAPVDEGSVLGAEPGATDLPAPPADVAANDNAQVPVAAADTADAGVTETDVTAFVDTAPATDAATTFGDDASSFGGFEDDATQSAPPTDSAAAWDET